MDKKLTIEVRGVPNSGKSTVAHICKYALKRLGYRTELQDTEGDRPLTEDEAEARVHPGQEVSINVVQTMRPPSLQGPAHTPWTVYVLKIGKKHYRTLFQVGAQHFILADAKGRDAKEHCKFMRRMFKRAMMRAGCLAPVKKLADY